jgi:uncharacterized protein YvpB
MFLMPAPARAFLSVLLLAAQLLGAAGLWLDVPFVRQAKNGCGAASVSMILRYWGSQGVPIEAATADAGLIQRRLYSKEARGIWGSDLEEYLRTQNFQTFVFAGKWEDLRQHLAKGRPLIVCLGQADAEGPRHYVVVTGLDEAGGLILVNDPQRRKLAKIHREQFEKDWASAGHWTLLAIPQSPQ